MSDSTASPCISICRLDDGGVYCVGCLRTLDEIRRWTRLDDAGRRLILDRVGERGMAAELAVDEGSKPLEP